MREIWDNIPYVVVRLIIWTLLWAATALDWFLHRQVKTKGWQLHRSIFAVLTVIAVKEIFTLAYVVPGSDNSALYMFLIVLYALADVAFLCLLMVISAGWCITRDTFGQYKATVIIGPLVYFISKCIADYIIEVENGHNKDPSENITVSSETMRNILLAASACNLFTLFYLWAWIFQTARIESRELEVKIQSRQAQAQHVDLEDINPDAPVPYDAPPPYSLTEASPAPIPGAEQEEREDDERQSEDGDADVANGTIPDVAKHRLLRQFQVNMSLYFVALVFLLLWTTWTRRTSPVLLIISDLIALVFLASLSFMFRLRSTNPYFVLSDYTEEGIELEDANVVGVHAEHPDQVDEVQFQYPRMHPV
eukprot:Colp12_sorted_trinity150504_noHs@6559